MTGKEEGVSRIIRKSLRTLKAAKNAIENKDFETASSREIKGRLHGEVYVTHLEVAVG